MRKGIKNRSRRARRRERLYSLAIDAAWIMLGTSIVWMPILLALITGGLIGALGL